MPTLLGRLRRVTVVAAGLTQYHGEDARYRTMVFTVCTRVDAVDDLTPGLPDCPLEACPAYPAGLNKTRLLTGKTLQRSRLHVEERDSHATTITVWREALVYFALAAKVDFGGASR